MTIEQFISNFESSIEGLEPGSIRSDTVFKDLPAWDSLALLMTLAMVDVEYGVTISGNEIIACITIQNLFDAVNAKRG